VLVAVSGGGDSMALLHVLGRLREAFGHELYAHGVDHGLRREASAELDLAAELSTSLEVPMTRSRLSVREGGNLQARARDARREALRAEAARLGATVIATAHHADDRAETVLLRLLRGAGPRGLAVLPAEADGFVRPFLRSRKVDIVAHLSRHAIRYASDPSNGDPRFLRTRVRRELIPLLEALSPGIVGHLTSLADQLGALGGTEQVGRFGALPRRSREAIDRLQRTKSAKARVLLPKGVVALYDHDQLSLESVQDTVRWKKR
jgi:tRNA(Ile)-lysidine synthase